ncbi:MAG: hypothetical protein HKN57_11540 [Xanthomonadales bacterium]|nr:hypothetical protein [Gammaproteobacteria bacterium]MBT8052979.1 hypothetical protein [Gammaproteobacteria bacterium]NND57871.1 hypothetical protein [Xanthomonadales bacterium]NNK50751.1 hypothetical protein [Xanthomonadales bacterium]
MTRLTDIGKRLDQLIAAPPAPSDAEELLGLGEQVLEQWVVAKGREPTQDQREGFRLLALHRQGADKDPSFNACRETCRELAYHYNLLALHPDHPESAQRARMMGWVANHLFLFISGKLETEQLGDFCCASKPLRETVDADSNAQ